MDLSAQLLQVYNRRGIFPLQGEEEAAFFQRALETETSAKEFFQKRKESPPFLLDEKVPYHDWDFPKARLFALFDVSPYWIEAYFSRRLFPWHGGMTWIFQCQEERSFFSLIQVRKSSQKEEVLAHEAVHVLRAPLESAKYEEMIAYMTSPSSFRKVLGSLFSGEKDATILLSLSFGVCFSLLFFSPANFFVKISSLAMGGWLFFSLLRLFFIRRSFNKAYANLKKLSLSDKKAQAVLFRLRDEEIDFFASRTTSQIKEFVLEKRKVDLRWRQIFTCYLQEVEELWQS